MSSFNRRFVLLSAGAGVALAGCGFSPAHAPGGAGSRLHGTVSLDDPRGRQDYLLVRYFEERLGAASAARYGLSYGMTMTESAIAISSNNVITRYNILGQLTYALRDLTTDKVLASGKVDNFTSYSASGTTVATAAAQRDARERLVTVMTDQMITRLTAAAAQFPA